MKLEVVQTDITKLAVDAIVNAANHTLCGGGGVNGAIHGAAGDELLAECRTLNGCETGHAKITAAYALPASFVIHAVGPVWHGGNRGEVENLASCYRECMNLATSHKLESIAFPAISCGVYCFPHEQACEIAVREVVKMLPDSTIQRVIFACFEKKIEEALNENLARWDSVVWCTNSG